MPSSGPSIAHLHLWSIHDVRQFVCLTQHLKGDHEAVATIDRIKLTPVRLLKMTHDTLDDWVARRYIKPIDAKIIRSATEQLRGRVIRFVDKLFNRPTLSTYHRIVMRSLEEDISFGVNLIEQEFLENLKGYVQSVLGDGKSEFSTIQRNQKRKHPQLRNTRDTKPNSSTSTSVGVSNGNGTKDVPTIGSASTSSRRISERKKLPSRRMPTAKADVSGVQMTTPRRVIAVPDFDWPMSFLPAFQLKSNKEPFCLIDQVARFQWRFLNLSRSDDALRSRETCRYEICEAMKVYKIDPHEMTLRELNFVALALRSYFIGGAFFPSAVSLKISYKIAVKILHSLGLNDFRVEIFQQK